MNKTRCFSSVSDFIQKGKDKTHTIFEIKKNLLGSNKRQKKMILIPFFLVHLNDKLVCFEKRMKERRRKGKNKKKAYKLYAFLLSHSRTLKMLQ